MHLRPDGFRELIRKETRFQPLPWFNESHEGHSADIPWVELWEDYVREARRFSGSKLIDIVGEQSALKWKFHDLPEDAGQWERNHNLIIGEFIRRHHARLSHEIAVYGFPGLPVSGENQFPAMGKEKGHALMRLADLIGLTARSHWLSLRVCKSYLDASPNYQGQLRPMGTAVLYPMALLRVADYLQIDRQRAPAVLLQLRNPPSPVSVQEWNKHLAVLYIGAATDPRGKMVTVTDDLTLLLYLQLQDLLAGLQAEMDHSTAVLDEVYGTFTELGLNKLNLATRRVYSNMQSSAYRDGLPYVPSRTGFTADPHLLTLLVEPLYGKYPNVGVRELMQNAADAVCELKVWCATRRISVESLYLPEQDGDVLIEFAKRNNGAWFLPVCDRGIGMTADTIQKYFLRAGASFRRSPEWAKEFIDEKGHSHVSRAGRFGIGAFAVFLLGPSFRLWTRHAGADNSSGYMIDVSVKSQLIEIRRVPDLPIGTTIEVELSMELVEALKLENSDSDLGIDWFCWDWPKIIKRVRHETGFRLLDQRYSIPVHSDELPPEWSVIRPDGFDAVYWTFEDAPALSCNGLRVADPWFAEDSRVENEAIAYDSGAALNEAIRYGWDLTNQRTESLWPLWPREVAPLAPPRTAVLDSVGNLPLTIDRYGLSGRSFPFLDQLARDVMLSFIAHALVCGPTSFAEVLSPVPIHPLLDPFQGLMHRLEPTEYLSHCRLTRWCATSKEALPVEAWLYSLLNAKSYLVFGSIVANRTDDMVMLPPGGIVLPQPPTIKCATLPLHGVFLSGREIGEWCVVMLSQLANDGLVALGRGAEASQVLVSANREDFWRGMPVGGLEIDNLLWRETTEPTDERRWFATARGSIEPSISLKAMIQATEKWATDHTDRGWGSVLYAAEIWTKQEVRTPESPIAKLWNECLGARAIPFGGLSR